MTLFLIRLTGGKIGLSALGIFVIDKAAALTVRLIRKKRYFYKKDTENVYIKDTAKFTRTLQ